MYIDFAIIDTSINEAESKVLIKDIMAYKVVNSITIPYYLIKPIKSILPEVGGPELSCFVDFPLGISDLKTRKLAIDQAVKNGATNVDITMPQNLAANRKYDKIRDDIKSAIDSVGGESSRLRYILEYRVFDHHCLKKLCEIFDDLGIGYSYPSTGYFIDNLADNILAGIFLYQNSKDLKIICTGNMWLDKHFDTINKSGLFGFRTSSVASLRNYLKFNLDGPKK